MRRRKFLQAALVACLLPTLAACAMKAEINSDRPFYITDVQVDGGGSPEVLADLQHKTQQLAAIAPQLGTPHVLHLTVQEYHFKNPAMSLLIGDSNNVGVNVVVTQPDSGVVVGQFKTVSASDGMINGPIGAIVAAASNKDKVVSELNSKAANDILERVYGSKVWNSIRKSRR